MESIEEKVNSLNYKFELDDKYIYVNNRNNSKYIIKSPYLKVLKANHEFKNKNYLIVQLDQDLDVDEQMDFFIKKIRCMDEYSKEILLNNSKNWYGKKWDIYTLDSMTHYPIDEQKGILYMKIIINKEDKELNKSIETLEKIMKNTKEVYISIKTYFKGLRWSREIFTEEWYLEDFSILEEENDDLLLENLIRNTEQVVKVEEDKNKYLKEESEIKEFENNISKNIEEMESTNINESVNYIKSTREESEDIKSINEVGEESENIIENEIIEINENSNEVGEESKNIIENVENKNDVQKSTIKKNKKKYKNEDIGSVISSSSKVKKRFILNGKKIK